MCYCDSKVAIKLVTDPMNDWHHYAAIINNIKDSISKDWRIQLRHILRAGNFCADFLAKLGASNATSWISLESASDGILNSLLVDTSSVTLIYESKYFLFKN